ncbi:MAG: DUF2971 domain-containing protein [Bacteroidetes bacterium]|nr:DUF2971 domain-containing protein [Bacteroidota bacterium]
MDNSLRLSLIGEFYDGLKTHKLDNAVLGMSREAFLSAWNHDSVNLEKRVQAELQKQINKEIGIYCLTTRPDSIQMWSYYANKHQGIVLEFNFHEFLVTDRVISSGGEIDNYYWKVNYPKKNTFLDFLRQGSNDKKFIWSVNNQGPAWKHENEYRVIMP